MLFKSGDFRELYQNHKIGKYSWKTWEKQLGILIQMVPILIIPGVAIVQTYRYLSKGPADIFEVSDGKGGHAQKNDLQRIKKK